MGKSPRQQATCVQLGTQCVSSLATEGAHTALVMGTRELPVMTHGEIVDFQTGEPTVSPLLPIYMYGNQI